MKLSIVIPVYRVEDTLDRCVESVVSQDYGDMEIILVDDGSPDGSPRLCNEWVKKDKRIHVVHQQNKGLSAARNTGIDQAQGEFITFIDSDDYIEPNTLAPLMDYLEHHPTTDILEYPIMLFEGSPRLRRLDFSKTTVYHDMNDYWYQARAYEHTYACNKFYRTSLFSKTRFPEGEVFEDVGTLYRLLQTAKEVSTVNIGCYHYCYNAEGITATADGQVLATLLNHHIKILSATTHRSCFFQAYYMRVLNIQIDVYRLTQQPPLLPDVHVNPFHFRGHTMAKALLANMLGVKGLCRLIKHTHHG